MLENCSDSTRVVKIVQIVITRRPSGAYHVMLMGETKTLEDEEFSMMDEVLAFIIDHMPEMA